MEGTWGVGAPTSIFFSGGNLLLTLKTAAVKLAACQEPVGGAAF